MLKELFYYLLGIYSQLKIKKRLKVIGIDIQRPFSPFDTSHLEACPPNLYRSWCLVFIAREIEDWKGDNNRSEIKSTYF